MSREMRPDHERLLAALFGPLAETVFDEETESNMRVRVDIRTLDRIVSVAFEDPLLVAN